MKKLSCFAFALLFGVTTLVVRAAPGDAATDHEIQGLLTDPAALTSWLEKHDAATHADTLARTILAVDNSQMTDVEKIQAVALSVARVIRTCGRTAPEKIVTVAGRVDARWMPVMVAAASLVRGADGLATQRALLASCTGTNVWETQACAAAVSPGQMLGAAIAMRTATPPDGTRPMPMSMPSVPVAARAPAGAAAPFIAVAELKIP